MPAPRESRAAQGIVNGWGAECSIDLQSGYQL